MPIMIKKVGVFLLGICCFVCMFGVFDTFAWDRFGPTEPINTDELAEFSELEDDTLRLGAREISENLDGVDVDPVDDTTSAWERVTGSIKTIVNRALSILWLVALVYLMYHGFMVLTAWSNDDRVSKWMKWVQYALIAIVAIGLTRLFLSLVFWALDAFT